MDYKFLSLWLFFVPIAQAETINSYNLNFENVSITEFSKVVYSDILGEGFYIKEDISNDKFSVNASNLKKSNIESFVKNVLNDSKLKVRKISGIHYIEKIQDGENVLLTYKPKYKNVSYLSELVRSAFPSVTLKQTQTMTADNQPLQPQKTGLMVNSGVTDRQNNEIAIFHAPVEKHKAIYEFLESIDIQTPQILLKAIAYEVSRDEGQGSAIDTVLDLIKGKLSIDMKAGFTGNTAITLALPNVSAIVNLLDGDSRFKSLTRPNIRVKSGSNAKFNVGSEVPILSAVVSQNNQQAVQSVEYRNSGVSLDVSPTVRQSIIDLKIKQEISNFVQTTTGVNNSPTLNKRYIETDLSLNSGEVVLIGGLEDSQQTESQKNIPFLKLPFAKSNFKRSTETVLMIEVIKI